MMMSEGDRIVPGDKLKLGKGVAFVKSRLIRLPACDEAWEADFRALPQPIMQIEAHHLGMVVTKRGGRLLADMTSHGKPTVNDLATLLANAMRRPLDANARRPRVIHLKANPRWRELTPVLGELGIGVKVEKKLPRIGKTFPALLGELRAIQRARMVKPSPEQPKVEALFPSIARYVQGYGFIEVGDQEGFGFVVRAIGYGGVDFEDDSPETLAEAMTVLEAGLASWLAEQGDESG
jgi:hypothetical protein